MDWTTYFPVYLHTSLCMHTLPVCMTTIFHNERKTQETKSTNNSHVHINHDNVCFLTVHVSETWGSWIQLAMIKMSCAHRTQPLNLVFSNLVAQSTQSRSQRSYCDVFIRQKNKHISPLANENFRSVGA